MSENQSTTNFEEIKCKRILITDEEGVTKTIISTDPNKNPTLTMAGESGTVNIDFRHNGILIGITDKAGCVKASLFVEDGNGHFELIDENGKPKQFWYA